MDRIDSLSLNLEKNNIDKIKQLFPEAVEEGKINFDMLRAMLGDEVDDSKEKYQFTWNGKAKSIKLAQTPSSATLRPCKDKSKYWDSTENLYIEGDNLEVLKQFQKTYYGKIKMIYIDPPYNTGNDFVYHDDFRNSIENYKEQTNQTSSSNPESSGRFHTDWLNMIYPRLILARNLMKQDGVIFISIGDNEIGNLIKVCNEIFGESNCLGNVVRVSKTTSFRGNYFAPSKDYILAYAKNINELPNFVDIVNNENQFTKVETNGPRAGEKYRDDIAFYLSTLQTRPNQRYYIECPDGELVIPPGKTFPIESIDGEKANPISGDGVWRWEVNQYKAKKHLLSFKKTSRSPLLTSKGVQAKWNIYTKSYLNDRKENGNIPRDIFETFLNRNGTEELSKLGIPFSFPKPSTLISYLMKIVKVDDGDIILDFFSGSGTTADAVLKYNCSENKSLKFVLIQLDESLDNSLINAKGEDKAILEKSINFLDGLNKSHSLTEIAIERIKRAGNQIKANWEKEHPTDGLFGSDEEFKTDIGFKVFKLDSTNVNEWDSDMKLDEKELALRLSEVFKEGRSKEDILYEIMLKYGVFDKQVEEIDVNGKTMYRVGKRYMIVCLNDHITSEDVKAISELSPRTVIFNEAGFNNDNDKINVVYNLEKAGVEDVKCI